MDRRDSISWNLVISGGGSGGHLIPMIAVCEALKIAKSPPSRIVVLTAERKIDGLITGLHGLETIPLAAIESREFIRRPFRSLWRTATSVRQAREVLAGLENPVVMASGGYGSLPGGLAAWRQKVPLIVLEQNCVAGRATLLLGRFANVICTSLGKQAFPLSYQKRVVETGNPLLSKILDAANRAGEQETLQNQILVLGGSQGSRLINRSLIEFAQANRERLDGWKIFHHTGITQRDQIEKEYRDIGVQAEVSPYFANLPDLYRSSRFVISRAGGTTLAELAHCGRPAILIPYPNSIRRHQSLNAEYFEQAGGAIVLEEANPEFQKLLSNQILDLMQNDLRVKEMSQAISLLATPNAARDVAQIILKLMSQRYTNSVIE